MTSNGNRTKQGNGGLYKGREEKEQEQERQKDKNEKSVKELLKNIIVLLHDEHSKHWD